MRILQGKTCARHWLETTGAPMVSESLRPCAAGNYLNDNFNWSKATGCLGCRLLGGGHKRLSIRDLQSIHFESVFSRIDSGTGEGTSEGGGHDHHVIERESILELSLSIQELYPHCQASSVC